MPLFKPLEKSTADDEISYRSYANIDANVTRDDLSLRLSKDHKPYHEEEKQRIIKAGGIVFNGRVNGDLAVARAFGDFAYKQRADLPAEEQEVSCQPDVLVRERSQGDNYIVFACDGIWDAIPEPQECVDEMHYLLVGTRERDEA